MICFQPLFNPSWFTIIAVAAVAVIVTTIIAAIRALCDLNKGTPEQEAQRERYEAEWRRWQFHRSGRTCRCDGCSSPIPPAEGAR
jgi:hypothetical protein